jgi:hypothetical protein
MTLIWRLQFHKILLNFNDGIVFGQDNGILANTKIGNVECGMWVYMLVCWYVGNMLIWWCWCWYVGMVIGIENVDAFVNFVVKVKNQQKNQQ